MIVNGDLDRKKIAENLDFVESDFIRGSTEAGLHVCIGVNLQEHTRGRAFFSKVIGNKLVTLQQWESATHVFL